MIVSAKYNQLGGIRIIDDLGIIMDTHDKSRFILEFLANGGTIEPADPIDYAQKVKEQIFQRLRECDWTKLDEGLTEQKKAEWMTYRAALRQVEMQIGAILYDQIVWPNKPPIFS